MKLHLHWSGACFALLLALLLPSGILLAQSPVLPLLEKDFGTPNTEFAYYINYFPSQQKYYTCGSTDGRASLTCLDIGGNVLWTQTYDSLAYLLEVFPAPNGDLVMHGRVLRPGNQPVYMVRANASGQQIWAKTFDFPGRVRASRCVPSENDSYIISAWNAPNGGTDDRLVLFRVDGNGSLLWSRGLDSGDFQVNALAEDGAGGCYFGGVSAGFRQFLGRFDKNGNLQWLKNYTGSFSGAGNVQVREISRISNGQLLVSGEIHPVSSSGARDSYVALADSLGTFLWMRRFPNPGASQVPTYPYPLEGSDGKVYVRQWLSLQGVVRTGLARMDMSGQVEKYTYALQANPMLNYMSLSGTTPERVILGGSHISSPSNQDGGLMVMDSSFFQCYAQVSLPFPVPISMNDFLWPLNPFNVSPTVSNFFGNGSVQYQSTGVCVSCAYVVPDDSLTCSQVAGCNAGHPKVCIPLDVRYSLPSGVIGLDYSLDYDPAFMQPTGVVHLGDVVTNASPFAASAVNALSNPGRVNVSLYYTGQAPASATFQGPGRVACVEFELLQGYSSGQTLPVSAHEVVQSYQVGYDTACALTGSFTLVDDSLLNARISFWNDPSRPLRNDPSNPGLYNPTFVQGGDATCSPVGPGAFLDLDGAFHLPLPLYGGIELSRDIGGGSSGPCPVSVLPVINAMDCYWTGLVTTQNSSWVPSAFQILAMDVNMDGSVTAGDITHLQNRIVQNICEFPQAWNQGSSDPGKDWRFVDAADLVQDPAYTVSANYPAPDNLGYSRFNVPNPGFCLPAPFLSNAFCTGLDSMQLCGVLLGDVNGTWSAALPTAGSLKNASGQGFRLDLDGAQHVGNCSWEVPLVVESTGSILGVDLVLDLPANASVLQVSAPAHPGFQVAWSQAGGTGLALTGFLAQGGSGTSNMELLIEVQVPAGTLPGGTVVAEDALLNGLPAAFAAQGVLDCGSVQTGQAEPGASVGDLLVYPNPFSGEFFVLVKDAERSSLSGELLDCNGRRVADLSLRTGVANRIPMDQVPAGIYFLRVENRVFKLTKL